MRSTSPYALTLPPFMLTIDLYSPSASVQIAIALTLEFEGVALHTPTTSIIPLSIYLKGGLCKVNVALCRGKKKYDKREDMKKEDAKKQKKQARNKKYIY